MKGSELVDTILTKKMIEEAKRKTEEYAVEGFLAGQGPKNPKFMLIGEAPGEVEAMETGVPFSGRAGKELMRFFDLLEVTREDVYITSPFRSRPYKIKEKLDRKTGELTSRKYNRAPNKKELLAHAPLIDYEIDQIQPPFILTMGNIGLQRLLGKDKKVGQVHGELIISPILKLKNNGLDGYEWTEKEYAIFPTFHPASIFYNRQLNEKIQADLLLFKKLIQSKNER